MSLAKLVVHLQANYANLTSGLAVARNQTASTAESISRSVRNISPDSIVHLAQQADQAASVLETVATTADMVEHSVAAAAFSAELAAGSFQRLGAISSTVGAGFGVLDKSTALATGGLQTALSVAGQATPVITATSAATSSLSRSLLLVSGGARAFGAWMSIAGNAARAMATRVSHVAHSMHAAMIIADLLGTALSMLMVPVRMIGSAAVLVFQTLLWAIRTVLLPVKLMWNGFILAAKAVWAIVKPIASVGLAVAKVWFIFRGWIGSIRMIFHWLSLLPPQLRLLVGALLALGLAGKAGALAIRVLGTALSGLAFVTRVAIGGLKLLLLPLIAIRNPAAAARIVLSTLTGVMVFAGRAAMRASLGFYSLGVSILRVARQGVGAAISSFASLGASMVKLGAQAAAIGAVAAIVWGVKLASAAETSRVVFGTMLHDMEQGKALLEQMQGSKVAPFFDAKAIQDAGRDLLKAKVPVDQITSRMEQLGGIAMATKTPIEDLSRIYRQGMARGAFQTDLVNQMAERGIDIYAALTAVTGKSGQALAEMMSAGKIGAAEMNAAIDHMTLGHGIYAGVVDNVAKTTAGMWSQSTNNITMALQTMFGIAVEGNGGLLQSFVNITEQIKQRAASIGPVILQLSNMITGIFRGLGAVVSTVWITIFGQTQATFAGMLSTVMDWITKFRWFFENIVPIVQFVGLQMILAMVTAFEDIAYWLTTKLPAYLTWFKNNWKNVFTDIWNGTKTVFSNIGDNIKSSMQAIWDYIKSGGTGTLEIAWKPLMDGFKSTVEALPEVPDRAVTALEEGMQSQIEALGTNLANSFEDLQNAANAAMTNAATVPPPVALQSTPAGGGDASESADTADQKGSKSDNSPLIKGSREAATAIFAAMRQTEDRKQKLAEKALKEQEKMAKGFQALATQFAGAAHIAIVDSLG
jgi:tape measure domain-containing protein